MQFSAHLFCSCSVSMPASAAPSLQRLSLTLSFSAPCLMQFTVLTIFLENSFSCMQQEARTAAAATVTVAGNTVIKCQQQCQLMPCIFTFPLCKLPNGGVDKHFHKCTMCECVYVCDWRCCNDFTTWCHAFAHNNNKNNGNTHTQLVEACNESRFLSLWFPLSQPNCINYTNCWHIINNNAVCIWLSNAAGFCFENLPCTWEGTENFWR